MAITYSAGTGTLITSYALDESLGDQSQQVGDNQIVISGALSVAGNGQIGDGSNGVGDSFIGRLVVKSLAGTKEERRCVDEQAGTGNTIILTVHEDWAANPVVTTDTVHVPYQAADIEDGGASGGISFNTRTGLFECTNVVTVQAAGGFEVSDGTPLEIDDRGSTISLIVTGDIYSGYEAGGESVGGGKFISYNNTAGEPMVQFQSGSGGTVHDAEFWGQLLPQQFEHANGAGTVFRSCKVVNGSQENHLFNMDVKNHKIYGKGGTSEIVRVDAGTVSDGLILSNVETIDTVADILSETITLEKLTLINVPSYFTVRQNKTINLISAIWDVTSYTQLTWPGTATGNELNDRKAVKTTVKQADGTLLQNAVVVVHEDTQGLGVTVEENTDVNGYAESSFIYLKHATNSVTTTYGGHAVRVDKWRYFPFIATQDSTEDYIKDTIIGIDSGVVQTVQATALTAGSGVTWNEDTNSSSIIKFTGGSGGTIGLAVDDTITDGTTGATGIVTEIVQGDGVAGTIHLKTRNTTAFSVGTATINNGADGWTATLTAASEQRFAIWLDGNNTSYQVQHDYWAAKSSENTLSTDGKNLHQWGRDQQERVLYKLGNNFYTERAYGKGVFIIGTSAGTVDYFTDDAGGTFAPDVSITITVGANVSLNGAEIRIYDLDNIPAGSLGTELAGVESNVGATYQFSANAANLIWIQIMLDGYVEFGQEYTIPSVDSSFTADLKIETNT